jgi:hypothetical protein
LISAITSALRRRARKRKIRGRLPTGSPAILHQSLRSTSGLVANAGEDRLYLLCKSFQAVGLRGFEGLLCERNGLAEIIALRLDDGLGGERER